MKIDIPDKITEDFLNFLDVSQACLFTEEMVKEMSDSEKECLKFIEKLLDDRASKRFDTNKEL